MADWATIRQEVQNLVGGLVSSLTVYDVEPDSVGGKTIAIVLPGDPLEEPAAHGRTAAVNFTVLLRAALGSREASERALDGYMGSVPFAIASDPTLAGQVHDTQFTGIDGYREAEQKGVFQAEVNFRAVCTA
jgi:hypothetical protein